MITRDEVRVVFEAMQNLSIKHSGGTAAANFDNFRRAAPIMHKQMCAEIEAGIAALDAYRRRMNVANIRDFQK